MLGIVVPVIAGSFLPEDVELLFGLSVVQPVVSHIPCFGSFLMYVVIYESRCCSVVSFEQGWWLGVS